MHEYQTDIVVIGSGPAGSAIARKLSLLGHHVLIVERARFPRSHIGESLSPGIGTLLNQLGTNARFNERVLNSVQAAHINWGGREYKKQNTSENPDGIGFVVDRGEFDAELLAEAVQAGAELWQPARADIRRSPGKNTPEKSHIQIQQADSSLVNVTAEFIVDASGRQGLLAKEKKRISPPTLAVYAYWKQHEPTGFSIGTTCIDSSPQGWSWATRLPGGTFAAAIFSDAGAQFRHDLQKASDLTDLFRQLALQYPSIPLSAESSFVAPARAIECSTSLSTRVIGTNWIKIGEAAFTIDPLSSQGVQVAMRSGLQAATVVHTMLQKPERWMTCQNFYQERVEETVKFHHRAASELYGEAVAFAHHPFWQFRSLHTKPAKNLQEQTRLPPQFETSALVAIKPEVTLQRVAVLEGEFINECPALTSPMLERPVAFVAEIPVVQLLQPLLSKPCTCQELLHYWLTQYGRQFSLQLWRHFFHLPILEIKSPSDIFNPQTWRLTEVLSDIPAGSQES